MIYSNILGDKKTKKRQKDKRTKGQKDKKTKRGFKQLTIEPGDKVNYRNSFF